MIFWSTPCCNDQCENDETKNDQDLHTAEIEFEFSKNTHSEIIDRNDSGEEKCNIQRWMACWSFVSTLIEPILDDECRCDEIVRRSDDVLLKLADECH